MNLITRRPGRHRVPSGQLSTAERLGLVPVPGYVGRRRLDEAATTAVLSTPTTLSTLIMKTEQTA